MFSHPHLGPVGSSARFLYEREVDDDRSYVLVTDTQTGEWNSFAGDGAWWEAWKHARLVGWVEEQIEKAE